MLRITLDMLPEGILARPVDLNRPGILTLGSAIAFGGILRRDDLKRLVETLAAKEEIKNN